MHHPADEEAPIRPECGRLPSARNVDDEPLEPVSLVDVDHDEGVEDVAGLVGRVAEIRNQKLKNQFSEEFSKVVQI